LISETILAKKYAKEPIVTVRILNYKVTVLGEVARPGVIPVPNERITLPEALGTAGDLTAYGKRHNVLLIREVNGQRIYKRFSLNQDQMFDKDIYNLQNQDIIYVEPNNARAASADRSTQLIPIGLSAISLLITIYVLFFK
jgi:polysaccharide export outer membrane protein